ncbi:MAG: type III pantothenate kinase [Eubacteriales bacterium]|nr:type III pantothenate kinase [Eubacteriales bacterium]
MLLVCNIGNRHLSFGAYRDQALCFSSTISAVPDRSADELAVLFDQITRMHGLAMSEFSGAILSSVVRPLQHVVSQMIEQTLHLRPLIVGPGIRTGLSIRTDIPSQLGADIVANTVAALKTGGGPLAVIALGTATTVTGVNADGDLIGVLIAPGVASSLETLSLSAAELPRIALEPPRQLLGRNTIDSMTSGLIYGQAAMVDGLIQRLADEWSLEQLPVVLTGRHAAEILPYLRTGQPLRHEPDLTLNGLQQIWQMNQRTKPEHRLSTKQP